MTAKKHMYKFDATLLIFIPNIKWKTLQNHFFTANGEGEYCIDLQSFANDDQQGQPANPIQVNAVNLWS